MASIDLDAVQFAEMDDGTKVPLALLEVALDKGQAWKAATCTQKLAEMAGVPAFCVLFKMSDKANPTAVDGAPDIESFRARCLWPRQDKEWTSYSPQQWAEKLLRVREYSRKQLIERGLLN
jgi:hypothetical protein